MRPTIKLSLLLASITALMTPSLHAEEPKLIRYFSFDNNFLESVYGNEPTELIGTPELREGIVGQALFLNGSSALAYDDYFDLSLKQFTITAWIYSQTAPPNGMIASKGADSYWMFLNNGEVRAGFYNESYHEGYSGIYLKPDNWYFVAVSYDGTTVRVFVNNHLQWIKKDKSSLQHIDKPFYIGALNRRGIDDYYTGKIDEVRLYNGALSKAAILQLYQDTVTNLSTKK